jgi:hypothetical protein
VQPENLRFGGGLSGTVLHPLVLVAMLIAIVLILILRRNYVVVPILLMLLLVPRGQGIYLGGVHIFVARIIILVGWVRLMLSKRPPGPNLFGNGFDSVDKAFFLWASFHAIAFILLYREMGAVINQFAALWDTLGAFFLFRFLIRSDRDVERVIKTLGVIAAILAVCMLNEHFRHSNVFGMLGGAPTMPEIRNGLVRAQGPFAHPLTAGAFGATLLCLFLWLWVKGKSKFVAAVGVLSSTIIAIMAASSTPILAYAAGIIGVCFWPMRGRMRIVVWTIAIGLLGLHLVMKAPVWFLIAHIDVVGGSSADQRAHLVDLFIRNASDWWLVGTKDTANWGWDMWDTCNQYVQEGETGGLASLVCFTAVIVFSLKKVGKALKAAKSDPKRQWCLWFLGAALFANVMAFIGISYHDQTQFSWFALLAIVSAVAVPLRTKTTERIAGLSTSKVPSECSILSPSGAAVTIGRGSEDN